MLLFFLPLQEELFISNCILDCPVPPTGSCSTQKVSHWDCFPLGVLFSIWYSTLRRYCNNPPRNLQHSESLRLFPTGSFIQHLVQHSTAVLQQPSVVFHRRILDSGFSKEASSFQTYVSNESSMLVCLPSVLKE